MAAIDFMRVRSLSLPEGCPRIHCLAQFSLPYTRNKRKYGDLVLDSSLSCLVIQVKDCASGTMCEELINSCLILINAQLSGYRRERERTMTLVCQAYLKYDDNVD